MENPLVEAVEVAINRKKEKVNQGLREECKSLLESTGDIDSSGLLAQVVLKILLLTKNSRKSPDGNSEMSNSENPFECVGTGKSYKLISTYYEPFASRIRNKRLEAREGVIIINTPGKTEKVFSEREQVFHLTISHGPAGNTERTLRKMEPNEVKSLLKEVFYVSQNQHILRYGKPTSPSVPAHK